ncbi:Syntaxin-binding protein 5 [Chamberlinius hualienensis]
MKKFTIKGVLDGIRGSVTQQQKIEADSIEETLKPDHFQIMKTVRHGFPHQPTAMAFDPVQKILAIGTKTGSIRILGRPGVDCHVTHESDQAVIQLLFLVNEGALVSVCADDYLHLWNLRQKRPDIVHSLKFQKERITFCHLPFRSKWLYIGTERGNVHVVNIESFVLSGYVINWNKAIELSRKTHPGAVVHLSDNPIDSSKLLIGFESSEIVLWDLRTRTAEARFHYTETLRSVAWHHEGRQFMCSHSDGSLTTWNTKTPLKPVTVIFPHAKTNKDGKPEVCKSIGKLEWISQRGGEMFVIFSGGLPPDRAGRTPSITVIHGKTTTVLEMEHNVIDFVVLCESPWKSDFEEPYAIVVLLHNDLVVVDLTSPGYLCFENPYPMDIHESPVTCCMYMSDCPADLIPAFYSVGSKGHKRTGFSDREWPVSGGAWGTNTCSYPDIIITGHADGSVKIWDASAILLQVLYKLKTAKLFEKPKCRSSQLEVGQSDDEPFAIQKINLCPDSRLLAVANASAHVILFRFSKVESVAEVTVLEIPIICEVDDPVDYSPEYEYPPKSMPGGSSSHHSSYASSAEENKKIPCDNNLPIRVKTGPHKRAPGYQAELVSLTPSTDGDTPTQITSLNINSFYGLLTFGTEAGMIIVDIFQKTCLLNICSPDLYADPYQRFARSPKRYQGDNNSGDSVVARCRSPTTIATEAAASLDQPNTSPISDTPDNPIVVESPPTPTFNDDIPEEAKVRPKVRKAISVDTEVHLSSEISELDENNEETDSCSASERASSADDLLKCQPVDSTSTSVSNGGEMKKRRAASEKYKRHRSHSWRGFTFRRKNQAKQNAENASTENVQQTSNEINSEISRRQSLSPSDATHEVDSPPVAPPRRGSKLSGKPTIINLNDNDEDSVQPTQALFRRLSLFSKDKIDNSFSRSRSSSMSSLENITSEAVQCIRFAESFTRKSDVSMCPTLWVGTSLGTVFVVIINLPPTTELRLSQPVIVSPSGTIFRLKGAILAISFLDSSGSLMHSPSDSWRDFSKLDVREKERPRTPLRSPHNCNARVSPTTSSSSSSEISDRQYAVLVSEKQVCVVALPSQSCVYKCQVAENNNFVVKADVITIRDGVCLACYVSNGHLTTFSLPSLRPLMDVDFLPLTELRIARTFCFSNFGNGMYLCSPCEIQKFTISVGFCENLQEMLGELFLPCETPEAPKEGFFKNLFGGGVRALDREELFGESSGKASRSVAKHIPGSNLNAEHIASKASAAGGEVARAHKAMTERGDHLSQLEDRSAKMMTDAEVYSQSIHQLMMKEKNKKWYQF